MVTRIPQCDNRRLTLALANRLNEDQSELLSRHLAACPHCRSELERLAGEETWWQDAKAYLSSSEELVPIDDAGRRVDLNVDKRAAENDDEPALDFLAPSTKPGMLGRLGGYEVERMIGRGGMGIVLLAHDEALQRRVAIKILAGHLAQSAAARKRFAREAQAAAAVVHDHVIPIHSVDTSGSIPFLVMPHIAGQSLQDRRDEAGILDTKDILRIAMQTAQGLAAAHAQGLVHRDIKPANILLENGASRVRITDFGLARAIDDASQTQSGFIAGTPQYMSPEQARGEPSDARADLFSLGSVMYAMASGHPPFRAETTLAVLRRICDDAPRDVRETNPDVPVWLAQVVHKLLAKLPDERYQSAAEVAALLERWLAHVQQPTVHPPPFAPAAKQDRKSGTAKWWALATFAALLATATIVALGTGILEQEGSEHSPPRQNATRLSQQAEVAPRAIQQQPVKAKATPPRAVPVDAVQTELEELARRTFALEARMPAGGHIESATIAAEVQQVDLRVQALEVELYGAAARNENRTER